MVAGSYLGLERVMATAWWVPLTWPYRDASGVLSHSPLLATYGAPIVPLVKFEVAITPARAPAVT